MNVSSRPWLLIPIETKAREFHSKVLFGCFAALRGWGVVIGPRRVIRKQQEFLPKGFVIEKSASKVDVEHMQNTLRNGNRLVGWDEEGLVYFCREDYLARRICADAMACLELFFCWGKHQYDDLCSASYLPIERFISTGNPRIDLLRPEFRDVFKNKNITKKYSPYILVNTKFAIIIPNDNYSKKYDSYIDWLKASGRCTTDEEEERLKQFVKLQEETLVYYRELLPALSERFPKHRIILRPHPSERNDFWQAETRDLHNVDVVYEGSANEWIYSADAMIHSNCTTGIEAFLLGKPSISFIPVRSPGVECDLANGLSIQTKTVQETLDCVDRCLNGTPVPFDMSGGHAYADRYIDISDATFASERILDAIEALDPVQHSPFTFMMNPPSLRMKLGSLLSRFLWKRQAPEAVNKRFPGIREKEVSDLMRTLSEQYKPFQAVRFKMIGKDSFCIFN